MSGMPRNKRSKPKLPECFSIINSLKKFKVGLLTLVEGQKYNFSWPLRFMIYSFPVYQAVRHPHYSVSLGSLSPDVTKAKAQLWLSRGNQIWHEEPQRGGQHCSLLTRIWWPWGGRSRGRTRTPGSRSSGAAGGWAGPGPSCRSAHLRKTETVVRPPGSHSVTVTTLSITLWN